jgi:hypothetical protein
VEEVEVSPTIKHPVEGIGRSSHVGWPVLALTARVVSA